MAAAAVKHSFGASLLKLFLRLCFTDASPRMETIELKSAEREIFGAGGSPTCTVAELWRLQQSSQVFYGEREGTKKEKKKKNKKTNRAAHPSECAGSRTESEGVEKRRGGGRRKKKRRRGENRVG